MNGWTLKRGAQVLVASFALMALAGCNKAKSGASAAGPKTSGPAASGSAPSATAKRTSCDDYADKICAKAGAESPTCTGFKEATKLMSTSACSAGLKDISVSLSKMDAARSECDKLVKTLCDAIGPKTKTCEMVTTQTKQFPPERCTAMLEHIPEITADLQKMEAANKPLTPELQAAIVAGGPPSFGPADAKVTLVEFSDFECPFCSRAAKVVHDIRAKYSDKVRFVFRQFPLPMHSHAHLAAEAALAANEQGKFWEFHDKLFENQRALDRAALESHAKDAGLNVAQFKKALDDKKHNAQVDEDM
ncbi:MAG TPA: thioredoxin domain-containing protein, partial [Polyangiaceae bacterium]|nr:thioredoxin domain-containing protein [Polyangiaceae bacterium]